VAVTPFTVVQGDNDKPSWTEAVDNLTTDYTCETFGELFADFAHQLRNGEHSQLMHRLNECAQIYGSVELPEDEPSVIAEPVLIFLTPRQQEVLELLNQGLDQPQIARRLWLSYDTVRSHTAKVRDYFDARSNREAVRRARAWGFVGPEGSPVGTGALWAVTS
jgi:DNA-binding CsgD family transcriptional regulator